MEVPKYKKIFKDQTPMYRYGKIGCFVHIEDNENPIDLRDLKVTGNPKLNLQLLNEQVDDLWKVPKTSNEIIMQYLLYGLIGLAIIGFIVIFVVSNKGS